MASIDSSKAAQPSPEPERIPPLLESHVKDLEGRQIDHEAIRNSPNFLSEQDRYRRVHSEFLVALILCETAASRHGFLLENSFFLRQLDDLGEAATMAKNGLEAGALNSSRRELRFMIEMATQALYVDTRMGRETFEKRVTYFSSKQVEHANADRIGDLPLTLLGGKRSEFISRTKAAWVNASHYVHPTVKRMREKLDTRQRDITIGFESPEMLRAGVDEFFEVASIVLVLAFESIGPSFTRDLFVGGFDAQDEWSFHSNPFIAQIGQSFDH